MRKRLSTWLLKLVIRYFRERKVHWMTYVDGQLLHRAEGKLTGGFITRDASGMPTGATMLFAQPGLSLSDLRRFPLTAIKRDKTLGWIIID
jgi:hypothetical protein